MRPNATVSIFFSVMIQLHLENGNIIWSPRFRRDRIETKMIQRRVNKVYPRHKAYKRLWILRVPSMEHPRRRGDMLHVYKMIKELIECIINSSIR